MTLALDDCSPSSVSVTRQAKDACQVTGTDPAPLIAPEMMRDMEVSERREARRLRSERSRAYYREWQERIRALRD
jgi:hypothetical protein